MASKSRIGSLYLELIANSAKFNAELRAARKETVDWSKAVQSSAAFASASLVAAGTAATAALAGLYASNKDVIDQLGKTADRLGETTEGLQSMRHAASLSGVEQKTLDTALQRMSRRLSEAAQGGGAAANAVKTLGLDAKALAEQRPEEALTQILDEMGEIPNAADKVKLSFALFDSDGVKVGVNLTGDAIRDARKELEDWGLLLSRMDVAKVEAANDAWDRVSRATSMAGQAISVELAPYVEAVGKAFLEAAKDAGGFRKVVVEGLEETILFAANLADVVGTLSAGFSIGAAVATQAYRVLLEGFDFVVNGFIEGYNAIPWVKDAEPFTLLSDGAKKAEEVVDDLYYKLIRLNDADHSADAVEFIKGIKASAEAAAEAVEESRKKNLGAGSNLPPPPPPKAPKTKAKSEEPDKVLFGGHAEAFARVQEDLARRSESFAQIARESLDRALFDPNNVDMALERERERFDAQQAQLDEALNRRALSEENHRRYSEQLEADHKARIANINKNHDRKMQAQMRGHLATLAKSSKAAFLAQKALAIRDAIVTAKGAVIDAYHWGTTLGGPPGGAAAAALATAANAAHIKGLIDERFDGGGGGAGGVSVATQTPPTPQLAEDQSDPREQEKTVVQVFMTDFLDGQARDEALARQMESLTERGVIQSGAQLEYVT